MQMRYCFYLLLLGAPEFVACLGAPEFVGTPLCETRPLGLNRAIKPSAQRRVEFLSLNNAKFITAELQLQQQLQQLEPRRRQ
jgi:hypothetical protein